MASWNTFLDELAADLDAITGIDYVERAAVLDVDKILLIPRWPKAIVTNMGGTLDFSGEIWERQVGITLAKSVPAGTLGSKASKELASLQELVVATLEHTRQTNAFSLVFESEEVSEAVGVGEVYMVTMIFSYQLERD